MSSVTLSMLLTARDEASATFRRVGTAVDGVDKHQSRLARTSGVLKGAMIGLGTAAVGMAGYFAVDSVRAFADAEKSQLALQEAFRKFPKMADTNIEAMRAMNTALQAKTRFDDDDLAMMQSKLGAFRMTGTQIKTLTPLIADYAARTGKDVISSGTAMGKALMGNSRALKEVGINFTASGNKAKDFDKLVEKLSNHVGGFAGKDAKSAEGQLAILDHQFDELKETVGKELLPYLTDMVKWATKNMPQIKAAVENAMPQVRKALTMVGHAAQDVGKFIGMAWEKFDSMPDGVKQAAVDLGAIAIALGAIKKTGIASGFKIAFDGAKSLFSAVKGMNVQAAVVNVNGKVTGGVPGSGGGGAGDAGKGIGATLGSFFAEAAAPILIGVLGPALVAKVGNDLADKFPALTRNTRGDQGGVTGGSTTNPVPGRFGGLNPGKDSERAIAAVTDALRRNAEMAFAAAKAGRGYNTALSEATKQARRSEAGIKGNSAAATQNKMALFQQAAAAQNVVAKMRAAGASTESITAAQHKMGKAFVATAKDMGVPAAQARDLARAYGLLPPKKDTKVDAPGAKASKRDIDDMWKSAGKIPSKKSTKVDAPGTPNAKNWLDKVTGAAGNIPRSASVKVGVNGAPEALSTLNDLIAKAGSFAGTYIADLVTRKTTHGAAGGLIAQGTTGTADDVHAMLSRGEYIVKADSVRRLGVDRLNYMNMMGALPGFKKGGHVPRNTRSRYAPATPGGTLATPTDAWADARWQDYNPAPTLAAVPAEPKKVTRGKKEKDGAWSKRQAAYRDAVAKRNSIIQNNAQKTADWQRTIADQRRDDRWAKEDKKTAENADYWAGIADWKKAQDEAAADKKKADEEAAADAAKAAEDAKKQHDADAQAEYEKFQSEARSGIGSGLSSMKGFASVSGFDLSAAATAQEELRLARSSVNAAGTPTERQAAINAVADAEAKAAAAAVTPANVTKRLSDKLAKIGQFRDALKSLRDKGLNPTTLSEIAQMSPEDGLQMASALEGSNLAEINSLQASILTAGTEFGVVAHNANLGADAAANAVMTDVIGRGGVATTTNVNTQLFLDGKQIYESLLALQRQQGGPLWST